MMSVNPATAEDRPTWVTIQMNTFTNWLNQQLMPGNVRISELDEDLSDGVLLIQVVETLQKRICTGKIFKSNPSEIQKLMNVQMALDALREDKVKLVNIGSTDIVEGNLKLILGLVWCLIQRYQIASHTKIPPKKLILAWLQSVLPEIKLTNYRTSWNDGVALAALLDYCQPGLFPDWRRLNPRNGLANCAKALQLAEKHLKVPAIVSAEHFSSLDLDELSTITYLSYFVKKGGPGYNATLDSVQKLLPDVRVNDFERSWNDGYLLSRLVEAVGGSVPGLEMMQYEDPVGWSQNVARALDAALELGVASLIGPDDIADIDVEHLGILALAAALSSLAQEQSIKHPPKTTERITSPSPVVQRRVIEEIDEVEEEEEGDEGDEDEEDAVPIATTCFQHQQLNLDLTFAEGSDVNVDDIYVVIVGPNDQIIDNKALELKKTLTEKGAVISFIPKHVSKYQVHILCEETELPTSPINLNVLPATQRQLESSHSSTSVHSHTQPPQHSRRESASSNKVTKSESSTSNNQKLGKKVGELVAALDKEHLIQSPLTRSISGTTTTVPTTTTAGLPPAPPVTKKNSIPSAKMDYYGDQASLVSFSGLNEPCSIGSIVEVVINSQGHAADSGEVIVYAEAPSGRRQPCHVAHHGSSFTATFTPTEVGEWRIGILYGDEHIKGSPFICQVYDANLVQVYGLDVGLVGQELKFSVDSSRAGAGEMSVSILRHGKQIPCHVEEETTGPRNKTPTGKFRIHFTPNGAGQYKIHIAFNNLEVKGSPFILDIADANSVSVYGDNLRIGTVDRQCHFMIQAVGAEAKDLSVSIIGPSNKRKHGRVVQIDESTFRVEFKPIEAGEHLIDVRLYDQSVYEDPFVCNVGDPELVTVKQIPKYIDTRDLNKSISFEIDAKTAGSGNLEIVINRGRVACRVRELSPREFVATFTPTQRVPHVIEMKFNGDHVRGSPWTVSTRESSSYANKDGSGTDSGYISELVGIGLHRAAVDEPAVFEISAISGNAQDAPPEPLRANNVSVKVTDPSGRMVDARIRELPDGVRCEYTVKTVGDHRLEVYINDRLIDSGPLYVAAYDPRKITITPVGGSNVNQPVQFMVEALEAGKGQLEISVNQGRVPNNVQMKGAGRCLVTFIPQHAGVYVIDVTFNGHQIHGCPIRVEVNAKNVGKPTSVSTTTATVAAAGTTVSNARSSRSQHGIAGTSPPPPSSLSPANISSPPNDRTTFHSHSPRLTSPTYVDTSYSYSSSRPPSRPVESPRSPPMVRQQSPISPKPRITDAEGLRSPRLLNQGPHPHHQYQQQQQQTSPRIGHTIAQYGDERPSSQASDVPRRYFGDSEQQQPVQDVGMFKTTYEQRSPRGDSGIDTSSTAFSPSTFSTPKPKKYFETEDRDDGSRRTTQHESRVYQSPDGGYTRRVEELTTTRVDPYMHSGVDYRSESRSSDKPRFEPINTKEQAKSSYPASPIRSPSPTRETFVRPESPEPDYSKNYGTMGSHVYDEIPASSPPPPPHMSEPLKRSSELERIPLEETPKRTADYMRVKEEDEKLLDKYAFNDRPSGESRHYSGSDIDQQIIEPYPSDLESITPSTRLKLESLVSKPQRDEYPHSHDDMSETAGSKPPSKPTTPKLSLRFGRDKSKKEDAEGPKGFDFSKSKISSKHEVIKRGKEVEVKVDNLKLSKEDVLKVVVTPPHKKLAPGDDLQPPELPHKVKKSGKTYEISFKPTEVGTHKVLVFVNDIPHPLAPFTVRVYDASQIIVGEITRESVINDVVEFCIDAGLSGFGNLEMAIKDSDGVIIPSHVSQLESGSAKFLVTFNPTTLGTHTVNITFNKEVIKGSPFEVKIVENFVAPVTSSEMSTLKSSDKKAAKKEKKEAKKDKNSKKTREAVVEKIPSLSRAGKPTSLVLSVPSGSSVQAAVFDATKNELPVRILDDEDGDEEIKQIQFTPRNVGDHEITIKVNGMEVSGSPFVCRVHDPTRIKVGDIPPGLVNKPVSFIVDASESGVGSLEVAVNEGTIASMARALGHHKYEISFVPTETIEHKISIRFNNEPVPGSPFICHVVSQNKFHLYGPGLERVPVGKATEFVIEINDDKVLMPEVQVTDPRGDKIPVTVSKGDRKGEFVVDYTPKVVGNHVIDVRYNDQSIGPAYTPKAFDASQARLSLEEDAVVGKPCTFLIDAKNSGAGNMEIIVSVDGKNVPNFVQAESQAKFKVSFTPQEAREHIISVKFNGQAVPGSPLKCRVLGSSAPLSGAVHVNELKRSMSPPQMVSTSSKSSEEIRLVGDLAVAQVGKPKGFSIDSPRRSAECNVVVTDTLQGPLPVRCYKQQDDSYWVEFTPEQTGTHQIEVMFGESPVAGSPFKCEVVDPKKVIIKGAEDSFILCHIAKVAINRRGAGNGLLEVDITDPQGVPLKTEQLRNSAGDDQVTFLPSKLGPHKLSVKVSGFQVPGTPKQILVEEQGKPSVYGSAIDYAVEKDNAASLIFDPKKATGGIKVDVRSPDGDKVRHSTSKRPDGTSEVSFRPGAVGLYKVSVDFNNKPVGGSPFQINVIDPKKVLINDENVREDGLLQLNVGRKNYIEVDTTAAGPGKLKAEVRDSEGELLADVATVENLGYGISKVTVTPKHPGNLKIYLYWAEQVVPTAFPILAVAEGEGRVMSPRMAEAAQTSRAYDSSDLGKVQLKGDGLRRAMVKQQAEFIVDGSDAPTGKVSAQLIGDKADIPVRLQHLGNNVHKATYTPLQGGDYELHVLLNGKHVPGSPSSVEVRSHASPAELVEVDSKSLKIGIINEEVKTIIDTRKAGSGFLSAQCVGPSKLAYCELYDHRDGTYLLSVRPTELGKHTLVVKYSEEHVPGSPFVFNVSNPPDPSKVKVYGPGVNHGILHSFKSNFLVETKGAGAGQLTVRVRGPKGAFNVEMQRDKVQDRTIHCKYEPREPGDYQVEVKWHGQHVPGSPFFVMIVDTEEELKRFLAGEPPSQMPSTPFIPPGWVGPPPMSRPGMMPVQGYPNMMPGQGPRFYGPPPAGPYPPPQLIHQQQRRRH